MFKMSKKASRRLFILFSLFFLSSFNPISSIFSNTRDNYVLFFDLGDVLLETNKSKAFFMTPGTFIKNVLKHGIPSGVKITQRLFELMDHQTNLPRGTSTATCANIAMPQIMCDWLTGAISSEEFVETIINISPKDPFFKSVQEGELLINTVKLMLPDKLVKINRTTKLLKVFQRCCEHDAKRVCILSNWDKSSIDLLKTEFPEIFSRIKDEQILFSGELGCKKPDATIFMQAANKLGAKLHRCVLIDDQITNIAGARRCGWKAILHTNTNMTAKTLTDFYGFPCV